MLIILSAMSVDGVVAAVTVDAVTNREIFFAYLDQALCPSCGPVTSS